MILLDELTKPWQTLLDFAPAPQKSHISAIDSGKRERDRGRDWNWNCGSLDADGSRQHTINSKLLTQVRDAGSLCHRS